MSEIKDGDAVVRIWPSGTLTFGQARIGGFKNVLLFYSLENYEDDYCCYREIVDRPFLRPY